METSRCNAHLPAKRIEPAKAPLQQSRYKALGSAPARIMMVLTILTLIAPSLRAQYYDVTTQPLLPWNGGSIGRSATCNLGQFIVDGSPTTLRLVGNSGEIAAATTGTVTTVADYAIACNHNSAVALVYVSSTTTIKIKIFSNTSSNGRIHMAGAVLEGTLPSDAVSLTGRPSSKIKNMEANMDNEYLYVTWMEQWTDARGNFQTYWFAIVRLSDNTVIASPQQIPLPAIDVPGDYYANSRATIACNRWMAGSVVFAFSYQEQVVGVPVRFRPAIYFPSVTGPQPPNSANLLEPTTGCNTSECIWVRAAEYDEPTGFTGFHYFYAYMGPCPTVGGLGDYLYSTDNIATWGPISYNLKTSVGGIPYSWSSSEFVPEATGNGYSDHSVYFAYAEKPNGPNPEQLFICRQQGLNVAPVQVPPSGAPIDNFVLGCNQMGIQLAFTSGGVSKKWRAFFSFDKDIQENTLATGLCKLLPRADFPTTGISGIGVGTHTKLNDTLRVFNENGITPAQVFQFAQTSPPAPNPPTLWAGEHFDPTMNDADPGNSRGHIILDHGATVDFGASATPPVSGATLRARSDGSVEYNGAYFLHQAGDLIGCEGEIRASDTLERYRGIWYMNEPLSILPSTYLTTFGINGGSVFGGVKGQVRFCSTSLTSTPFLTISGQGSGMIFDQAYMYLGSSSTTTAGKIIWAGDAGDGNGAPSNITFANGLISNLWQHNGYFESPHNFERRPDNPGSASLWDLEGIATVNVEHNLVMYNQFFVKNPTTSVTFSWNSCECIQNLLDMQWAVADNSQFAGQANILNNTVMSVWPFGSGSMSDASQTMIFDGFHIGDQRKVMCDLNKFYNRGTADVDYVHNYNPYSTGILIENGSNVDVSSNQFNSYATGIDNQIVNLSNSFYCNNSFMQVGKCSAGGTGIMEEGDRGACFPKLNGMSNLNVGYWAKGMNGSTLIENSITYGNIGAKFQDQVTTIVYGSHTGSDNYAAYNHFENNTITQVSLVDDGTDTYLNQPQFGLRCGDADNGVFGENTFTAPEGAFHMKWENHASQDFGYPLTRAVTENHWSPTIGFANCNIPHSYDGRMYYVTFYNSGASTHNDISFECGGGYTAQGGKGSGPTSLLNGGNPVDPSDTEWMYWEALGWLGVNDQLGLDTMRLFVQRYPAYFALVPSAIGYTLEFVDRIAEHADHYDYQPWIDEYNWLVSIYQLDTARWYQSRILSNMAEAAEFFDRNLAANLSWNDAQLFPFDSSTDYSRIAFIRHAQAAIPQDTTPFHKIPIPPVPYGLSAVLNTFQGSTTLTAIPNPANESLTAVVDATFSAPASIELFDQLGNRVQSLPSPRLQMGENRYLMDCTSLPAGNYYLRLSTGGTVRTVRIAIAH